VPLERNRARGAVRTVDACDFLGWNELLHYIAPREDDESRERARETQDRQPPDVPDQCKPTTLAKKAVTTPVALLRGTSIGS
jgi:hypothetical protein